MKLQYQLGNGRYVDIPDGYTERFLEDALQFDKKYSDSYHGKRGFLSIDDVVSALESGAELRHGTDWYNEIRDGDAHQRKINAASATAITKCNWGGTRYDESCARCGRVTAICNDCELCESCHDK